MSKQIITDENNKKIASGVTSSGEIVAIKVDNEGQVNSTPNSAPFNPLPNGVLVPTDKNGRTVLAGVTKDGKVIPVQVTSEGAISILGSGGSGADGKTALMCYASLSLVEEPSPTSTFALSSSQFNRIPSINDSFLILIQGESTLENKSWLMNARVASISGENVMFQSASEFGIIKISGDNGVNGKTAYESAQDGGFVGTETDFNTQLASIGDINAVLDEINGEVI